MKRVLSILTVVSLVLFASVSVFGAVPQKVAYIVENALGDQPTMTRAKTASTALRKPTASAPPPLNATWTLRAIPRPCNPRCSGAPR